MTKDEVLIRLQTGGLFSLSGSKVAANISLTKMPQLRGIEAMIKYIQPV